MTVKGNQAETLNKWVRENHMLHDSVLFKVEFCSEQNESASLSPGGTLRLWIKIPTDIEAKEYAIASISLKSVSVMQLNVEFSYCDGIFLTGAEIAVSKGFGSNAPLRLRLLGSRYSEDGESWNEQQVANVTFGSFELCQ